MNGSLVILENALNDAISETGRIVANELEKELNSISSKDGEFYERTGQTVNAFRHPRKVHIGATGKVDFSIFDSDKIIGSFGSPGKFNKHMSMDGSTKYKGTPISELVPIWLSEGFKLPNGKKFDGLPYLENALQGQNVNDFVEKQFIINAFDKFANEIIKLTMGG